MINNLVKYDEQHGQLMVSSLDIAEKFEKTHSNVIRAIEAHLESIIHLDNTPKMFVKIIYQHSQNNQSYIKYLMNRDGFSFLVMGFTGRKAVEWKLKYIEAFNQMEEYIRRRTLQVPTSFPEALRLAAEQAEQLALQRPLVEFATAIKESDTAISVRDFAKQLKQKGIEIGEKRLYQWLRSHGYVLCNNSPSQRALELGFLEIKETIIASARKTTIKFSSRVTPKGQEHF